MSNSSFTVLGYFLDIFLRRSGSLTPFRKAAMTTASLRSGMEFFFFMNHRDGVLLLHEPPDEFPKGFAFLMVDLVEILDDSRFCISSLKIINKLGAEISPRINRILCESREPVLYCWG